jgi:hypothetical protein
MGSGDSVPRNKAMGHKADHSISSSATVNSNWSRASAPHICYKTGTGDLTTLI